MLSTGSPLSAESFDFVYDGIKDDMQLASISGGTDICGCFVGGNPLSPVWRGEIQGPMLGVAVDVYDGEGRPVRGEKGELAHGSGSFQQRDIAQAYVLLHEFGVLAMTTSAGTTANAPAEGKQEDDD